jgi:hypothetical protein
MNTLTFTSSGSDDGYSKHLWNISQFIQNYVVLHPWRQLFIMDTYQWLHNQKQQVHPVLYQQ